MLLFLCCENKNTRVIDLPAARNHIPEVGRTNDLHPLPLNIAGEAWKEAASFTHISGFITSYNDHSICCWCLLARIQTPTLNHN